MKPLEWKARNTMVRNNWTNAIDYALVSELFLKPYDDLTALQSKSKALCEYGKAKVKHTHTHTFLWVIIIIIVIFFLLLFLRLFFFFFFFLFVVLFRLFCLSIIMF
jgi:hypothetical protein